MAADAQAQFDKLVDIVAGLTHSGEVFLLNYAGEDSDFVRLNQNRVRQAGHVLQRECGLSLIRGRRNADGVCGITGDVDLDRSRLGELVGQIRGYLDVVEDDPYLCYATTVASSHDQRDFGLPESRQAVAEIIHAAEGLDLVGLWASGVLHRGFANSLGQRNWYGTGSFNFDFSVHLPTGKAVKCGCAGQFWDPALLETRITEAREQAVLLGRDAKMLEPGRYRVYLAPHAMTEIMGMLEWGGFSLKSHRTRQTPLLKMVQEDLRLHPDVTLVEEHAHGFAPGFTSAGFVPPGRVSLIELGAYRDCLADRRSAAEYGVPVNAEVEAPRSLIMHSGDIPLDAVLERLVTGLYINNLWYCNFSDRGTCRLTGSTRFACFWVDEGRLVAPINTMRFDESVYHMFGEGLIGLTREQELMLDPGTYECRSTASMRLPGALIDDFRFTL